MTFFNAKGAKVAKISLHLRAFALITELAEEWHVDFDDNHDVINSISAPVHMHQFPQSLAVWRFLRNIALDVFIQLLLS
ncbi:MAG: hypothetical protein U0264_08515 [Candidatus Kapaibacterium sp.]